MLLSKKKASCVQFPSARATTWAAQSSALEDTSSKLKYGQSLEPSDNYKAESFWSLSPNLGGPWPVKSLLSYMISTHAGIWISFYKNDNHYIRANSNDLTFTFLIL